MHVSRKNLYRIITALYFLPFFYSCSTFLPVGTLEGGVISMPDLPLSFRTCSVCLTDRTGLPADNRYALQYLETLLAQVGLAPHARGNCVMEVSCREQCIETSLRGILSISAVLTITDSEGRVVARYLYLGQSKGGLESDLLLYRIINRLIRKMVKSVKKAARPDE